MPEDHFLEEILFASVAIVLAFSKSIMAQEKTEGTTHR